MKRAIHKTPITPLRRSFYRPDRGQSVQRINYISCSCADLSLFKMRISHCRFRVSVSKGGLHLINREAILNQPSGMRMAQGVYRAVR